MVWTKSIIIGQCNANESSASRSFNLDKFDFCAVEPASDQSLIGRGLYGSIEQPDLMGQAG
jgi:hypothetical protein